MIPPTLESLFGRTSTPLPDCKIWNGDTDRGYGRVSVDGKHLKAHRVAWELRHGPIPDGLTIDHLCRVRPCVNPDHMELVTPGENARRAQSTRVLTKCVNGHPYDDETTRMGSHRCAICRRATRDRQNEKRRKRRREAAAT